MKPKNCQEETCTMIEHKSEIKWFNWFKETKDGKRIKFSLMPCIPYSNLRIDHCPTCGAYVRDFEIKEEVQ